jgi:hypothetical protein
MRNEEKTLAIITDLSATASEEAGAALAALKKGRLMLSRKKDVSLRRSTRALASYSSKRGPRDLALPLMTNTHASS